MPPSAALIGLTAAGTVSFGAWLGILADPRRPWDLQPVGEELPFRAPDRWPSVLVVVPARNEARLLPRTLPALLTQDYPGEWHVVLVDDRSGDATGAVAKSFSCDRLTVVTGRPLPSGWAGKVWALAQGVEAGPAHEFLLLTDADILHAPGSLRRLAADAVSARLDLTSRMARLHCRSKAEMLTIPPFLLFFNLLYPMRRVNDPGSAVAAAAGGCIFVRRETLERAGGPAAIRGEIIDDVNLARLIKQAGGRLRLAVSRGEVASARSHTFGSAWRMVRRTAFDELRYSWPRLGLTVGGLLLLFAVPPTALAAGAARRGSGWWSAPLAAGAGAWALSALVYRPTVRFFGLAPGWSLTLPPAGLLYGGMTFDSALRHATLSRHGRPAEAW